ncbi:hypothetical protein NA56DRAFT_647504 [Hyaloscypha hepaticicola]|uniref:Uncharacterized protein n=1 Tax=Hyaloscypha hepaticicola TaxID=2082293 RepID=A0A2J6PYF7_9HELO|nr:hypothetical protein NA56DRAFT_647504 [Hyaloscypha hepaticicola]
MASRNMSPGGALLRASRVFSIPPPLPRPGADLSSAAIFNSDSATLAHPIHQTITTPQSSLARGDWGFKRPLPLRATTKSSTPFIRVESIDTYEHITEFNSSADHSISLQKWQEMGVPLTIPAIKNGKDTETFRSDTRRSVFDSDLDSTTADQSTREELRWKFKGPWLAGLNEVTFKTYVTTEVRNRKLEFQDFMRAACAKALTREARRLATEAGESEQAPPTVEASDVTEEQFIEYIKELRTERTTLYKLIRSFLDLPPAPLKDTADRVLDLLTASVQPQRAKGTDILQSESPYAKTGPPKTHPSAGLAYSRSAQHIYNHPTFGPQRNKKPVKARVIMPKSASTGSFGAALGVGGFVTELPNSGFKDDFLSSRRRKTIIPGVEKIEPDKVGGSKLYVNPTHARIDPKGRVLLNVESADEDAVAVLEGTTNQIPLPTKAPVAPSNLMRSTALGSNSTSRESRGYGLDQRLNDRREGFPKPKYPASPSQEDATRALMDLMK